MSRSLHLFIHTAGPQTALIKSSGHKEPDIVIGGRMFSIPILHRVDRLSLGLRTIIVRTANGVTINGVGVSVESACQIKIQGWSCREDDHAPSGPSSRKHAPDLKVDISAVRLAAQHFLGKTDNQIEDLIQRTISGHQRAIIGSLTVEQLYRERATFSERVLELITADMRNMGLAVVSYTVADISDNNGYIDALGVTQTEKVKREAAEGAAMYRNAAKSRSSQLEAAAHLIVNTEMRRKIESDRERSVQELLAREIIQRQSAVQAKAYDISSAEQDSVLLVKQKRAIAEETRAQLAVASQEVEREKLSKERQVNVEADAALYKARVLADAQRAKAMAEAERVKLIGEAEANSIKAKGMAEVEILQNQIMAWEDRYVHFLFVKPSAMLNTGFVKHTLLMLLPGLTFSFLTFIF